MKQLDSLAKPAGKKEISLSTGILLSISLLYLLIPVIIFAFGWLRIWIAVPASLLLAVSAFFAVRNFMRSDTRVNVSVVYFIVIILSSVLICYVSGIGEFVWSTQDHAYRRAIFNDLMDRDWPVIYDLTQQSDPVVNRLLPDTDVAFSYYFTFWMVPCVIGRIFGHLPGNVTLLLWSSAGVALALMNASCFLKRQSYALIYSLIFFSGLDFIPYIFYEIVGKQDFMWLEGYTQHIVIISNINNILNVFNQCIPCWLIVSMYLISQSAKDTGFTGSLMFPYSPWATIGLIPFAVYNIVKKENRKIRDIITAGNIIPPAVMLVLYAPMYMSNSNATEVSGPTVTFYGSVGSFLTGYLTAVAVEILPAFILIFSSRRKDPLFWVATGSLLVIPFYKITYQNDFNMRGSMPALFVLTVMLAGVISSYLRDNKGRDHTFADTMKLLGGFVLLLMMSMVAVQMLLVVASSNIDGDPRPDDLIGSFGDIRDPQYVMIIDQQFFVYDYGDTFFYKYMARTGGGA